MAKAFMLSPHQRQVRSRDLQTKDVIIAKSTKAINEVLRQAVTDVYDHWRYTGNYKDPDLDGMDSVVEAFYRSTIEAAVTSCRRQSKVKKLATPKGELPEGEKALDRVLTDRKYFQKIMKRAKALTGRAKRQYLDKLRRQFRKVIPLFETGDLNPKQVKQKIADAWRAPQARVDTIFRTESTRYFAEAQVKYFEGESGIIGFLFDSVRDTSRTTICQSRHGLIYKPGSDLLKKNTPALHYNCRSHLIPLIDDAQNRRMLADPKRDPEKVKVEPLPPGWTAGS